MKSFFLLLAVVGLAGCSDKYQEGFQAGYTQGSTDAEAKVRREYESKTRQQEALASQTSLSTSSTSTCGGSGITVNGKHYDGGKTGCVKVYSDGRVERY